MLLYVVYIHTQSNYSILTLMKGQRRYPYDSIFNQTSALVYSFFDWLLGVMARFRINQSESWIFYVSV